MTAIDILNALKANRHGAVLWVDHDKKEAAYHPGCNEVYATVVDYDEAMMARTDPNLNIEKYAGGELISG